MSELTITVGGEPRAVTAGTTVTDVVVMVTDAPQRVAVAVNGEVVPRRAWEEHELADGDRVEVVAAIQGGAARVAPAERSLRWTIR